MKPASFVLWYLASIVPATLAGYHVSSSSNRTLGNIIQHEQRFVLYNSRRLSGECLSLCTKRPVEEAATELPTATDFPIAEIEAPTAPTRPPSNPPTKEPTNAPTNPSTNVPTNILTNHPTHSPTYVPTNAPTNPPSNRPTKVPTNSPTGPQKTIDCATIQNLGYGFSKATGTPHYDRGCFPVVKSADFGNIPGYDDSVSVFSGGSYIGRNAAEVEGNIVVLGNLEVGSRGPGNFVSVGVGTHVLPNPGGDCIIVGGDISADRDIQVFNQKSWMKCDIVYKGNARNLNRWKIGNGEKRRVPDYDMTLYEQMKYVLMKKSQFWKTLTSTGTVEFEDWGSKEGETKYMCSSRDEVQVFNILSEDRKSISATHTIKFGDNCEGKTILINVHGQGAIGVDAAAMSFKGKSGYGSGGFPSCLTTSILWNFPDASMVDIGNGKSSEFHGSILVGTGDLKLSTSGHSGRAMVVGNIIHDSNSGSEFHSYEFNPPKPLPDPEDVCVLPENWRSYPAIQAYPTTAPTGAPTRAPSDKCTAIPQNDLPSGSWATNDSNCAQCAKNRQGGAATWWPCNQKPYLCEGNCKFAK